MEIATNFMESLQLKHSVLFLVKAKLLEGYMVPLQILRHLSSRYCHLLEYCHSKYINF